MNFSNALVYGKSMSCGTTDVKTGRLDLQNLPESGLVREILQPEKPVVFVDLVGVEADAKKDCKLTCYLVEKLISHGLDASDIGVITPLNDDVKQIKSDLKVFLSFYQTLLIHLIG